MFSFTFELITLAVSNPLVLFCFCNLIIGFLLVDGSKSTSNLDNIKRTDAHCKIDDNKALTARKIKASDDVTEAPCVGKALVKEDDEVKDNEEDEVKDNEEEDKVKDNEEDDELKRRVEEFIDKINRGWKAEKLGSSALVQSYGHSNTSAPITGV